MVISKDLKPIRETAEDYEKLEKYLKEAFKREIYRPLLKELGAPLRIINTSGNALLLAIQFGVVQFHRGVFSGRFNAGISKELKAIGATWEQGKWKLSSSKLPMDIRNAISASEVHFQKKLDKIDQTLAKVVPEEFAESLKMSKFFDSALWKVEKSLVKSMAKLIVTAELSDKQRQKIADDWQNNMKLWITDFTKKQVSQLRADMQKTIFAGNRAESAVKTIQKSYGVSENKAKFLARQETSLLMTTYKEGRYQDAGINEYKWRCVSGTPNHPVRPMHKELNDRSLKGEIFRFDTPPVDDPNGSRHNPGQNYNCRCTAVPVVKIAGNYFNPKGN